MLQVTLEVLVDLMDLVGLMIPLDLVLLFHPDQQVQGGQQPLLGQKDLCLLESQAALWDLEGQMALPAQQIQCLQDFLLAH